MAPQPPEEPRLDGSEVAVIGMACRFPGARNPTEYWRNLRDGVESITFFDAKDLQKAGIDPAVLSEPNYVSAHGALGNAELLDAPFFGLSPREAEIIDPQHRVFLECAWQALEDAAYDTERYPGTVGIFAGTMISHYMLSLFPVRDRLQAMGIDTTMLLIGNDKDSLTTRVAHKLNLKGPAMAVQTACSTSLVAVHLAAQSLLDGGTDMALAGGVSITLPQTSGYTYDDEGFLSPDGHCRAFDANARGTVFGSGCGVVVLKRLDDALTDGDAISAVLRGSAINNDGSDKVGYTAPSINGQAEVIVEARAVSGVEAHEIGYVETHGTGTSLGDPVEIAALEKAFGSAGMAVGSCAVGSVKTNIGHLEAAAGIAGFIKAVLALRHGVIPPSLNWQTPNPKIDFANSRFFVNTELRPLDPARPLVAVSSFGFGGTNAHAILAAAPAVNGVSEHSRSRQLLVLSARTETALDQASDDLAAFLEANEDVDLADVGYTSRVGRRVFEHRRAVVAEDRLDAARVLRQRPIAQSMTRMHDGRRPKVIFMFSGQGSQHLGMGAGLYREVPFFRQQIDTLAERFRDRLGVDFREVMRSPAADAEAAETLKPEPMKPETVQPAIFSLGYALVQLLDRWGLKPSGMIGHSLGEYVAACVSGALPLDSAVELVAARAELLQGLPVSEMVAVYAPPETVEPLLGAELALAAVNGPELCVVSGSTEAVQALEARMEQADCEFRRLHTSHAFHSAMMDPILEDFRAVAERVELGRPEIPYVSTLTGEWQSSEDVRDPGYWVRHLRETVQFGEGLTHLLGDEPAVYLEVGSGQTLQTLAARHPLRRSDHEVLSSLPHARDPQPDFGHLLLTVGRLWAHGLDIDEAGFPDAAGRRRVSLPTYPFERRPYWIDGAELGGAELAGETCPSIAAEPIEPAESPAPPVTVAPAPASTERTAPARPDLERPEASYIGKRYAHGEGDADYAEPKTDVEQILAEMWQDVLGIDRVGIHDNFFGLGGNSLVALQILKRIQSLLFVKLPVRTFFESPTVAELASIVAEKQPDLEDKLHLLEAVEAMGGEDPGVVEVAPAPEPSPTPASPVVPLTVLPPVVSPAEAIAKGGASSKTMRFSLFFFSGNEAMFPENKYELILEGAKFADRNDFAAIWTPERHFHSFGGLYPSPSVLSGGLATVTNRLSLRAGSVVLPLHQPIRVAEEWSVVDNLSAGRVGLSFASGFHPHDFVLAPDAYAERRDVMFDGIEKVRELWRGGKVTGRSGAGDQVEVSIMPRPVQPELPVWVTCANNPQTFEMTGAIGANVLTSLIGLTPEVLAQRIELYRAARAEHGHDPDTGEVAVMLHTFLGEDQEAVKETVREPFCGYLRSHTQLLRSLARSLQNFDDEISEDDLDELLEMEFERYFYTGSLLGTPESCLPIVERLQEIGVDEIGCLLDFGVDLESVMKSLDTLNDLRLLTALPSLLA